MTSSMAPVLHSLVPIDEPSSHGARVWRVPRSFSSANHQAFMPQFVVLGPYADLGPTLLLTDELKLGVAKRVLKVQDTGDAQQHLQNFVSDIQIQAFYHMEDDHNTCDSSSLLYVLTVDGLFLLGLLHSGTKLQRRYSINYIITGKHYGPPPVNAAGVELSMDGIIRDVFMLENQIPIFVLKHISEVNINSNDEIHSSDKDLGSLMLNFCKALSPLAVHSQKLSKDLEAHDHLLDLMYCLITAESESEPDPEPQPQPQPDLNPWSLVSVAKFGIFLLSVLLLVLFTILWTLAYVVVAIERLFLKLLSANVILLSAFIFSQRPIPNPLCFLINVYDWFLFNFLMSESPFSLLVRVSFFLVGKILRVRFTVEELELASKEVFLIFNQLRNSSINDAMIPSATQLHNFRIRLKAVEGSVSSIKFYKEKRELYVPCIKLDAKSEVILRNLVVYESLIEIDRLNFSTYIQLMTGLTHTVKDAKLLIDKKIIQTQLSAEVVTQIFKMPIGELIGRRPAEEIQEWEGQLKKIKPNLDAIQNLNLIFFEFVLFSLICAIGVLIFELIYIFQRP